MHPSPRCGRQKMASTTGDFSESSSGEASEDEPYFTLESPVNSVPTPSISPPSSVSAPPVPPDAPETASDETWARWTSHLAPTDLSVDDRRVLSDAGDLECALLSPLGKGISGCVYAVQVVAGAGLEGVVCALKVFRTDEAAKSQGTNEVVILEYLARIVAGKGRVAIPDILAHFTVQGHIAFLMELGGPNLFQIIGTRNYVGLTLPVIRGMLTKLLEALVILEGRGVVHADIKPENILVSMRKYQPIRSLAEYNAALASVIEACRCDSTSAVDVILVDWSSASIGYSQSAPYIQSRFYRAPEVIMRGRYGPSVDIWSLGCVAAELFLASPLFPGGDEIDMLRQIQLKLGILPRSVTNHIGDDSPAKHTDAWRVDQKEYSPGNFELFLRERSGRDDFDFLAFINILRLMLQLNCDARITATSGMLHPFITGTVLPPRRAISRRDSMMEDSASSHSGVSRRQGSRRYSRRDEKK